MINSQTYWIILIAFLVVLNVAIYVIGKKKRSNIAYVGLLLSLAIIVVNKWTFPNVYIVNNCSQYDHKIMLLPKTENGVNMSLGKHCYVINKSTQDLTEETIIYGQTDQQPDPPRAIKAGENKELPFVGVDYFF